MKRNAISSALALAISLAGTSSTALAKSYVDEDGNKFDPRCEYNRYNGPCLDVDLVNNEPRQYEECNKFIGVAPSGRRYTAEEYAACNFGLDEARRMSIRYGGGHGQMHGYIRGFAWGLNKMTTAYQNDGREMQRGRDLIAGAGGQYGQYFEIGRQAGITAGKNQGNSSGSAEARARFAAAMDTGRLPSDQIQQIPPTNYAGEDNAYERHVKRPMTPQDIMKEDLRDLNTQIGGAYSGLDSVYVDYNRGNIWDYWYGDGIYTFETRLWMDKDRALNVWLQRPIDTKPKYEDLNRNAPTETVQVPVLDPVTGQPVIDPTTGRPVTRPEERAIDLKAIFRSSFVNSYGYYVSYNYSKALYGGLSSGQIAGEMVGIELGKRMAQQSGLIQAFNEMFKAESARSFRGSFESAYMTSFNGTYADYRNNPKLEVSFDRVIGQDNDGILQPGEAIAVQYKIRNFGGAGSNLRVTLEGNVQDTTIDTTQSIAALTSKPITTGVLGRIDSRLRNGQSANIALRVNNLSIPRAEVVRRQIEVQEPTYSLNVVEGTATIRVGVTNVSTVRSAGQVTATVTVAGMTDSKIVGFVNPGETQEQVFEFRNIDPMALITGSETAAVQVVMNEATMATDSVTLVGRDRRLDTVKYYNQVVNGRGYVPARVDRESRVAELARMIVTTNDGETRGQPVNIWRIDGGLGSTLGLLVNEYRQTSQTPDALKSYRALAQELYKSRKNLGKFLFFKSAKRKAYESLCKQLPLK